MTKEQLIELVKFTAGEIEPIKLNDKDAESIVNDFVDSEQLAISQCNCDKENQKEEEYDIQHLINNTYQVVGKETGTVWKQGTMEECNDWVML